MEIKVTGRHCQIKDDLREEVTKRLGVVQKLRERVIRVEVQFTCQPSRKQPDSSVRAEITLIGKGPVVRAEGAGDEKLLAFDRALERLKTQLRRAADRRRSHRGLRPSPIVAEPAPAPEPVEEPEEEKTRNVAGIEVTGDGPLVVREKHFRSAPLTLEQALDEMELVGHDFFLFVDADSQVPSVVYRRRGYDYGVLRLEVAKN